MKILQKHKAEYAKANRKEKKRIAEFIATTNSWSYEYARKQLKSSKRHENTRKPRGIRQRYSNELIGILTKCWIVLDFPSSQRLSTSLSIVLDNLAKYEVVEISPVDAAILKGISPATIDRRLRDIRNKSDITAVKGNRQSKANSTVKSNVPVKTWSEWKNIDAGYLCIDLVHHSGGNNNNFFLYTIQAVDRATGWNCQVTIPTRASVNVKNAMNKIVARYPFEIKGIHSDNGTEFINQLLYKWCKELGYHFTRSRPYTSNDNAPVEQKNWSIVRRIAGYGRYETSEELKILNKIWELESNFTNYVLPQQHLIFKEREGAKVRRRYIKEKRQFKE